MISDSLRRLIPRQSEESPKEPLQLGTKKAEVIAVCAQKGGVGKTTTAVNLAAGLALLEGKKVLLLDMDPQSHCALSLKEVWDPADLGGASLSQVLVQKKGDVYDMAVKTAIPGLFLCPSDGELSQSEAVLAGRIGKEFLLRKALARAKTFFDVVVIDCPPNLGTLTLNALLASDWLLAPCDMSTLAVEGIYDIFETLDAIEDTLGHRLSVLGVLRTRYDGKNKKVNEAVEKALEPWAKHLLGTTIPVNTTLAQAQLEGRSIYEFAPQSRGAKAYEALAKDVLERALHR